MYVVVRMIREQNECNDWTMAGQEWINARLLLMKMRSLGRKAIEMVGEDSPKVLRRFSLLCCYHTILPTTAPQHTESQHIVCADPLTTYS